MSYVKVDTQTGEVINDPIVVEFEQQLAINIDANMVREYHHDPKFIADYISMQAGRPIFDVTTKNGRKECASFSAKIIKTIAPIVEASKNMASDAKKIVAQDLEFRKQIEPMIRFIAAEHRKPLTELEEEEKRIENEQKARELARIEEERLLTDWVYAIELNELFELRKKHEWLRKQINVDTEIQPAYFKDNVFSRTSVIKFVSESYGFDYIESEEILVEEFSK